MEIKIEVTVVTGGYKIVLGSGREGFAPKIEQVPQRIKEMLTPDFKKAAATKD